MRPCGGSVSSSGRTLCWVFPNGGGQNRCNRAAPAYYPSMGDLMTMTVQPRHIKLGLSGKQENWVYAKYELNELRNAFARIARTIPRYQSIDTAALTTVITQPSLNSLEQAIDAKSTRQFTQAYSQLTDACNACHRNRNH